MKSIDFPGAYLKIGEGQDQYHTVHAMPLHNEEGEVLCMYKLSDEERAEIARTGIIYYSRWTFNNQTVCKQCLQITPTGFQPFLISAVPFRFKSQLDFDGQLVEVECELREDGVHIPGYTRTPEGKYIKDYSDGK
jgi:hypothetical protein